MSNFTDILIATSSLEETGPEDGPESYPALESINNWLSFAHHGAKLFVVKNPNAERYGPTCCFMGSVNHLNTNGFLETVNLVPWKWREQVQIFLRKEDDKGFQPYPLVAR